MVALKLTYEDFLPGDNIDLRSPKALKRLARHNRSINLTQIRDQFELHGVRIISEAQLTMVGVTLLAVLRKHVISERNNTYQLAVLTRTKRRTSVAHLALFQSLFTAYLLLAVGSSLAPHDNELVTTSDHRGK